MALAWDPRKWLYIKGKPQQEVACAGARSRWTQIRVDLAEHIRVGYVRWALRSIPPQPKSRCDSRLEAVRVGEKQGACSWLLQVARR